MPSPEPRGSHEGAITSRQRLSYKSRSQEKIPLSRESREKTPVESYSQGEPGRSLSEPQETQYESGKDRRTYLSLVSQERLSQVSGGKDEDRRLRERGQRLGGQSLGVGEYM